MRLTQVCRDVLVLPASPPCLARILRARQHHMAAPWFGDFRDKVVVVTGASSGIGRETALAFAAVGARVALVARRRSLLEGVAREIRKAGGKALIAPADITRGAAVRAVLHAAADRFGGL